MNCPFCEAPGIEAGYHECPKLSTDGNKVILCPMSDAVVEELAKRRSRMKTNGERVFGVNVNAASRRLEEIKAEAEAIGARNKERAESIEADLARLRELVKELEE